MKIENYCKIEGIDFIEFSSENPEALHKLFLAFGFSRLMRHNSKKIDLYKQNDIYFFLNFEKQSFGTDFYKKHGPCVSSMGWRASDAEFARNTAIERGAKNGEGKSDYKIDNKEIPSIYGIGDSLIYFIDNYKDESRFLKMGFVNLENPDIVPNLGFEFIDHLTNNVENGKMEYWANFYKNIFGFYEIRYFDIKGVKTGLVSYALRSPDGSFCIPINEGTDRKSQINEYLDEYKGAGVQHIALHTSNIIDSVSRLQQDGVETLDMDDEYYQEVFDRVPNVKEDHNKLQDLKILIDGDEEGYLLQIFTKNVIGPIFFEIIQRKNHHAFGEGNFGALFRSIEKDQQKRGYLD